MKKYQKKLQKIEQKKAKLERKEIDVCVNQMVKDSKKGKNRILTPSDW